MVLESLTSPFRAEQRPWKLVGLGVLYGSLALLLAMWVFAEEAGIVSVFFIVYACLPLFFHTMRYEEQKISRISNERNLLREHAKTFSFFVFLFIGLTAAIAFWYVVLPNETTNEVFKVQTTTIANLNQHVTGGITQLNLFSKIFLNNIKVLIFAILFSFLYGSGGLFILSWNSSVIGVAFGNFIRSHMSQFAESVGFAKGAAYLYVTSLSVLRYAIHGIPEILAYFIAGLAGGILSVCIVRKEFDSPQFEKILLDFSDLVLLSVFVLFIAGLLEVYVTPFFFV